MTIEIVLFIVIRLLLIPVYGAQVPAMFVFGDSLVDPGNNNNLLLSLAKANYMPNGIDFPQGVTGRFCNGGTVADHLGYLLGLPLIPPYNNPNTKGPNILLGVNYGSAASGILNETGHLYGKLFPMDYQIQNFENTLVELTSLVDGSIGDYLKKSLFFVCIGNNDYINNYLLPLSDKPHKYTPEAYADLLLNEFSRQIMTIYKSGGRKFLIAGLGPLGCLPNQIGNSGDTSTCVESTNHLASVFNAKLKPRPGPKGSRARLSPRASSSKAVNGVSKWATYMIGPALLKPILDQFNADLQDSYFLFWDTYASTYDVINNYKNYGFKHQHSACCGAGRVMGQIICLPVLPLECHNRTNFVFWDPYHPTDAFNIIASKFAYQGNLQPTFPRNVHELVQS